MLRSAPLVPMGRVRESRPVSTRPRRPCPPIALQSLISKGQWYKTFQCRGVERTARDPPSKNLKKLPTLIFDFFGLCLWTAPLCIIRAPFGGHRPPLQEQTVAGAPPANFSPALALRAPPFRTSCLREIRAPHLYPSGFRFSKSQTAG